MRALLLLSAAALLHAQGEASLKTFFEGKTVLVKLDMPATESVDIYPRKKPQVDFKRYTAQLTTWGAGLQNGEIATIAAVHVTEKNIEIQLKGESRQGSRFRIWYPNLKEAVPAPQEIQTVLSSYVDFGNLSSAAGRRLSPAIARGNVQRGMRLGQVLDLLGAPFRSGEHTDGSRRVVTQTFRTAENIIEVDFVRDVVVDFRIRTK